MIRRTAVTAAAGVALVLAVGASTAAAAPIQLLLPQSTAFSILGHSCGGIQEHAYATGFDAASGYPAGAVYIQTRCGGSGRGGGYHTTTYAAWVGTTWDFAGGVLSASRLAAAPAVDPAFSATDANGDQLYNTSSAAYLVVVPPAAPYAVSAVQVDDQLDVSWTAGSPNPAVITSSTVTATPVDSTAPALTATASGSSASAVVGPLEPATTYAVTVVSADAGGAGAPSDPVLVTTAAASVPPDAPTGVAAFWTMPGDPSDMLVATWDAATGGDSPVDAYEVEIEGSDGGTFTQTVDGATLTAAFTVSDVPDWSVSVRAHDAAGWGAWSDPFVLGGE